MSTSRNINRICAAVTALSLALTLLFMNGASFGIASADTVLGYENRLFDTSYVHTLDIVMNVCKKCNVSTNRPAQRWMLEQITKSMVSRRTGNRTYILDNQSLDLANKVMFDNGFIQKKITYKMMTKP